MIWVGIGGYAHRQAAQVGTSADCRKRGAPRYSAWFAIAPNRAFPIPQRVLPGDTIRAAVAIHPTDVELQLQNRTRGWSFRRAITWLLDDTTSAEWIVEAPTACTRGACAFAPLANFGVVHFANLSATANALTGGLTSAAWTTTAIRLVPSRENLRLAARAGAAPGSIEGEGAGFSVLWIADAPQ